MPWADAEEPTRVGDAPAPGSFGIVGLGRMAQALLLRLLRLAEGRVAAGVEDVLPADDIDPMIEVGVLQRGTHPCARGEVDHHLGPVRFKHRAQRGLVADKLKEYEQRKDSSSKSK